VHLGSLIVVMSIAVPIAIVVGYAAWVWPCPRILDRIPWLFPIVLPALIVVGLHWGQKQNPAAWRYVLGGGIAFLLGLAVWLLGTDEKKESAGRQDTKSEIRETKRQPGSRMVLVGMWFVALGVLEWVLDYGFRGVEWLFIGLVLFAIGAANWTAQRS
jgi:hypothetical protein